MPIDFDTEGLGIPQVRKDYNGVDLGRFGGDLRAGESVSLRELTDLLDFPMALS